MSRLPERLETPRLVLRVPVRDDVEPLNAAVAESFAELTEWMPWAAEPQTLAHTAAFCADARAGWEADERYGLIIVDRHSGMIVGGTGYPRLDWTVPKFEIGYWCRSSFVGRGYASEATQALTRLAFDELGAVRVELRMDDRNERSWRVAERLGFELEGLLRADSRDNHGGVRDTRVYALVDPGRLRRGY